MYIYSLVDLLGQILWGLDAQNVKKYRLIKFLTDETPLNNKNAFRSFKNSFRKPGIVFIALQSIFFESVINVTFHYDLQITESVSIFA